MDEIVSKIQEAPPRPRGSEFKGSTFQLHVEARADGGQKKVAETWSESDGVQLSSRWRVRCDEGPGMGEDTAPPPLMYFALSVAF